MAKSVGKIKILELLRTLNLNQKIIMVDRSDVSHPLSTTVKDLIFIKGVKGFSLDEEVESIDIVDGDTFLIEIDVIKKRALENVRR